VSITPLRQTLRAELLARREGFANSPEVAAAELQLARELRDVLDRLEPERLGVYWPMRSEFNAALLWQADKEAGNPRVSWPLALPFAQREPHRMHYRAWDGRAPALKDECGIAASEGPQVVPDVVLVPCVGFTRSGLRLGYGGGYFDRWLAAHPHVTAIGVAWSVSEMTASEFVAEPHDAPLTLVVTEQGVVS
jgi:5-formyltetrahydrofolate cyclo-ligase